MLNNFLFLFCCLINSMEKKIEAFVDIKSAYKDKMCTN